MIGYEIFKYLEQGNKNDYTYSFNYFNDQVSDFLLPNCSEPNFPDVSYPGAELS